MLLKKGGEGMRSDPALLQNDSSNAIIVEEGQEAQEVGAQTQATIIGSHLADAKLFSNDYYRLYKEGHLTK